MNRWELASTEVCVSCHLQRSEGAGARGTEMLRWAQHDKGRALIVTQSEVKGLARGATRCFAGLSMTKGGWALLVTLNEEQG